MGVDVTIPNVPDEVRDELASRAVRAGQSLQEYLRVMLIEAASHPSALDVIARARAHLSAAGLQVDAESILVARDDARR